MFSHALLSINVPMPADKNIYIYELHEDTGWSLEDLSEPVN